MSPRTGRPKADNPKKNDFKVRLDDEMAEKLENYCEKHGITKSEAFRKGIELLLNEKE